MRWGDYLYSANLVIVVNKTANILRQACPSVQVVLEHDRNWNDDGKVSFYKQRNGYRSEFFVITEMRCASVTEV